MSGRMAAWCGVAVTHKTKCGNEDANTHFHRLACRIRIKYYQRFKGSGHLPGAHNITLFYVWNATRESNTPSSETPYKRVWIRLHLAGFSELGCLLIVQVFISNVCAYLSRWDRPIFSTKCAGFSRSPFLFPPSLGLASAGLCTIWKHKFIIITILSKK